jgi:hypothetical protein
MAFAADQEVLLARLDEELRGAAAATPGLFAKVIAGACSRIPLLGKTARASKLDRLIDAGAWTDAALALLELELPAWKLRRLAWENDEWFCSLSRQPNLPVSLDDSADAVHQVLPLAIMRAFVEARRRSSAARETVAVVPHIHATTDGQVLCCDNFA